MRELPDPGDLDRRLIAAGHEAFEECPLPYPLADPHAQAGSVQLVGTQRALHECQQRGDDDQPPVRGTKFREHGEPLAGLVVLGERPLER